MRISFHGKLSDEPEIRAGFIGCGSHSFRNIYPTFQFTPVNLISTCDLDLEKAKAFSARFGAKSAYKDYREMLAEEDLDAVFVVVGYDSRGRPLYPQIAMDCLSAGCHVWIEKPPAASCKEIELMKEASHKAGKNIVVGMKKMFFPANEKAAELSRLDSFGGISLGLFQYPQYIPAVDEFKAYLNDHKANSVVGFLDHLCHPMSLIIYLMGMPVNLFYERSESGSGVAAFTFDSGSVASLALTHHSSMNYGFERTTLISRKGGSIIVDNNIRVTCHRDPPRGYGNVPDFYLGTPEQTSATWEPEFSLGQLYNKGLFLLGYYGEINEFARSILENRAPVKGTLDQAWQVTRVFEAFAAGPGKMISLEEGKAG